MTDLQTKNVLFNDLRVNLPFVVNEFERVQIPPKTCQEEKTFKQMGNQQQHKMMARLIDHVKDL